MSKGILLDPLKYDDKFDDETPPREMEKILEATSTGQKVTAATLWTLSALLTFGFGAEWLSGLFSPLFTPFFPVVGVWIGKVLAGLFVAFTFDLGALNALRVYIYGAKTEKQQEIMKKVLWVDFVGSVVASVAQMILSLSGGIVTLPESGVNFLGWSILLTTIGVFVFNLVMSIKYYEESPAVIKSKHDAKQRAAAIKRRHEKEENEAAVMATIAKAEADAENEVLASVAIKYREKREGIAEQLAENKAAALYKRLERRENINTAPTNLPPRKQQPANILPPQPEAAEVMAATYPDSVTPRMVANTTAHESGESLPPQEGKDINFNEWWQNTTEEEKQEAYTRGAKKLARAGGKFVDRLIEEGIITGPKVSPGIERNIAAEEAQQAEDSDTPENFTPASQG